MAPAESRPAADPPRHCVSTNEPAFSFSAHIGHTHTRLAVTDLLGKVLADETGDIDLFDGPETVLGSVNSGFGRLLSQVGQTPDAVLGIGIGIPAPVDLGKGRVSPPAIPDWDDYPIRSSFSSHFPGAPILIDNDANVMALGEHRHVHPDCAEHDFVKVGTRIGAGRTVHAGFIAEHRVRQETWDTRTSANTMARCARAAMWAAWRLMRADPRWRAGCRPRACQQQGPEMS